MFNFYAGFIICQSRISIPENLRIPEHRFLPEGYACATTDRCFLLANCCASAAREKKKEKREKGKTVHLIWRRRKKGERGNGGKLYCPAPRVTRNLFRRQWGWFTLIQPT